MIKNKKKIISIVVGMALLGNISTVFGAGSVQTQKLVGDSRYSTAVKVSNAGWSRAENAVIVNSGSMADALCATPFAKLKNAPILLTQKDKLNDETMKELRRLGVKKVYLVDSGYTLSQSITSTLQSQGIDVEKIFGKDMYETSLKVAKEIDKIQDVYKIAVVNGNKGIPDAVSVAAPSATFAMPIIFSSETEGTKVADIFIHSESVSTSYVIGGVNSVSDGVLNKLPNAYRLGGIDRNDTNAKVINHFYSNDYIDSIYIAKNGMKNKSHLVDALSVGVLAGKINSPVLIGENKLSDTQRKYVGSKRFNKVVQVGGGVNEPVFNEVVNIANSNVQVEMYTKEIFYSEMKFISTYIDGLGKMLDYGSSYTIAYARKVNDTLLDAYNLHLSVQSNSKLYNEMTNVFYNMCMTNKCLAEGDFGNAAIWLSRMNDSLNRVYEIMPRGRAIDKIEIPSLNNKDFEIYERNSVDTKIIEDAVKLLKNNIVFE